MSSETGTLSTTDQVRPAAAISALRFSISAIGHTAPFGR